MAGEAAGESILFIAAVLAAGLVSGALLGVTGHYVNNLRDRSNSLEAEFTGRIAIINDPGHMPNGPLVLYVKNTGGHAQDLTRFAVLLDGTALTAWTATVNGSAAQQLDIGQVATLSLTGVTASAGDHVASVVSDTNFVARLSFTV